MCYSDFEPILYLLIDEIAFNDYEEIRGVDTLDNFLDNLTKEFGCENDDTELVLEDEQKTILYNYYKTLIEDLRKFDEYLTPAVNVLFVEKYGNNNYYTYIKWGILNDCFYGNFDDYNFIYEVFECALGLKLDDETEEEIRKIYRTLLDGAENYRKLLS